MKPLFDIQIFIFQIQCHQRNTAVTLEFSYYFAVGKDLPHLSRQDIALFQTLFHALGKLRLRRNAALHGTRCLI